MKHLFLLALVIAFGSTLSYAQPCVGGTADGYPCQLIDQLAFMDLNTFSAADCNDVWGWTSPQTGREYAILGLRNGTAFIDISTPEHPIYLGKLPTATVESLWRDAKVVGHYACIGSEAEGHGVQIFDLRRLESLQAAMLPMTFTADAHYVEMGNSHNIVADTARSLIYAVGSSTLAGGLHGIDLSDPLNPQFAGGNATAGYVHDAQAVLYSGPDPDYQNRYIVAGFNEDRMVIYDATDLLDIEIISETSYESVGYTHQGWFTPDQKYLLMNDELDELFFGFHTRTIVWDMNDLDDPQVLAYTDFGNSSIDHNLFIKEDMVYESNYTSGLRVFDLLEVGEGVLQPFGYFDVVPQSDTTVFSGSWSNYPYFSSGVIPVSSMDAGLHLVKPRFFALDREVIQVCAENTAELTVSINRRLLGEITFSVEMADEVMPILTDPTATGAPVSKTISWDALNIVPDGYYPGEVVISYGTNEEERLPFVLVLSGSGEVPAAPQLISPIDTTLSTQQVTFTFNDQSAGYAVLEVSALPDLGVIYSEAVNTTAGSVQVELPFENTAYQWRLIKPLACAEELESSMGTFEIADVVQSTANRERKDALALYPNPADDVVTLAGDWNGRVTVAITDVYGRQVWKQWYPSAGGSLVIDISSLPAGTYVVSAGERYRPVLLVKQ